MALNEIANQPADPGRQVVVVTGAASGIGRATATAFTAAGFTVLGTSRKPDRAHAPEGVSLLDLDVTDDESVRSLVDRVIAQHGRIDVLVNNAGMGLAGAAEESSIAQTQALFEVNVMGVIRMTNAVLPHMRTAGRGRIINVSSVLGFIPAPFMAAYAATKHAVEGFSESVDHEVRDFGVRVLLIQPAYTSTSFESNTQSGDLPLDVYAAQRRAAREAMTAALQRADAPEVVAEAVVSAATATGPQLRYQAGQTSRRVRLLRRIAPSRAFDTQIRRLNGLTR